MLPTLIVAVMPSIESLRWPIHNELWTGIYLCGRSPLLGRNQSCKPLFLCSTHGHWSPYRAVEGDPVHQRNPPTRVTLGSETAGAAIAATWADLPYVDRNGRQSRGRRNSICRNRESDLPNQSVCCHQTLTVCIIVRREQRRSELFVSVVTSMLPLVYA